MGERRLMQTTGPRIALVLATLIGACGKSPPDVPPPPAVAPAPHPTPTPGADAAPPILGVLHFDVSGGTPAARAQFEQGLLALHSFWYDEAQKRFQAAIDADPTFAMAYWGLAMSHAKLLWNDDDIDAGRAALQKLPSPQTLPPHDQAWVVAALSLFKRATPDVHASRQEFLGIMEQIYAKYPDDEAALFLSLALLSTLRPNTPTELDVRRRAGGLALEVFKRNPKHPGAAHYLIHAYDTPALAALALPAAQQYATIAPSAFHALHMPAHIFSRLGMWKEAAVSCEAAWASSVAWVQRDKLAADHDDFHSLQWLIEIAFERGRRADADRWMTMYSDAVRGGLTHQNRAAFANQVASYLARTGEWTRVDELLAPLQSPASDDAHAAGSGVTCGHAPVPMGAPTEGFERRAVLGARALAAAERKDVALLKKVLAERDAVDAELHPFLVATQTKEFVASSDELRGQVRAALMARATGDLKGLVAALRPLAADQELEFTGEGTAGGVLRSEEIADALLAQGDARAALEAYRDVLVKHVGRTRSLRGAARAATKAGDSAAARTYYGKLLENLRDADPSTEGLDEAKRAVGP